MTQFQDENGRKKWHFDHLASKLLQDCINRLKDSEKKNHSFLDQIQSSFQLNPSNAFVQLQKTEVKDSRPKMMLKRIESKEWIGKKNQLDIIIQQNIKYLLEVTKPLLKCEQTGQFDVYCQIIQHWLNPKDTTNLKQLLLLSKNRIFGNNQMKILNGWHTIG